MTSICDALCNLLLFIRYKKREKYPWKSDTFSKAARVSLQTY